MYVGYESTLSQEYPKFLATAMLPCTMLWSWIAGELIDFVDKKNPYYGWFEDNKPDPNNKTGEVCLFLFLAPRRRRTLL